MKRLSLLTLVFAILSVVFFLLLIFLRIPFPLYPLMNWQDAVDILTPLVLIPLYWILLKFGSDKGAALSEEIAFMVLASFWVAGQGMHLSANSVNNLSEMLAKKQVIDILGTDIYKLTYFYDEHLSHYIWHIGILGVAALLIFHEWRSSGENLTRWGLVVPAGILYGFTTFCFVLEGQTVPLGLPFAVIITLIILLWGLKGLRQRPLRAFFLVTYLVTTVLFLVWVILYGGFPQFSDVGLI